LPTRQLIQLRDGTPVTLSGGDAGITNAMADQMIGAGTHAEAPNA
jgi:hypothetical protein